MSEKVIGFSIEIKGTDSEVGKLGNLKREILTVEQSIKKLTESTKGNSGAQKASATQMSLLETQLKGLKSEYNAQQKAILDTAKANQNAVGSYNALTAENAKLSAELRALPIDPTNEKFKSLQAQLLANTDKLKTFDESIGRHQRNVGNYGVSLTTLTKGFHGLTGIVGALGQALNINTEALTISSEVAKEAVKLGKEFHHIQQLQHAATSEQTVATEANTVATIQQTVAERILNAVKQAGIGTWIAVGVAIAAVVGGMVAYFAASKDVKQAEEDSQRAMDGTIIKSDELRKSWNEHLIAVVELNNAYKVMNGSMTEAEAELSSLNIKNKVALSDIKNEQAKQVAEISGFWHKFGNVLKDVGLSMVGMTDDLTPQQIELLKIQKETEEKLAAQQRKTDDEALALRQKNRADKVAEYKKSIAEDKAASAKFIQDGIEAQAKADEALRKKREEFEKSMIQFRKDSIDLNKKLEHEWTVFKKDEADQQAKDAEKAADDELARVLAANQKKVDETNRDIEHRRKLKEDEAKQQYEFEKSISDGAFSLAQQFSDMEFQAEEDRNSRKLDQKINALSDLHDTEIIALDTRLKSGAITEAQFRLEKEAADKKQREEELKLKKEAFEEDKKLKLKQVALNLAMELVQIALAASSNPTNAVTYGAAGVAQYAVQAALAIGRSAIEAAAIQSQTFATGGIVKGPGTETSDSIPVRVSKNEAIINANSTKMFWPVLSAMNQAGGGRAFAMGGVPSPSYRSSSTASQSGFDLNSFAERIVQGINDKKVYQVESDVSGIINKVAQIESSSTF